MANISYDGHGIIIDGRHVWLVIASMDYARIPHQLWRDRVRAARQAGFNCIQTSVFWDVHEPQPGVFRFEEDTDLRRFIEMIGEEGMYAVLRPGPFVGGGWDMGGLPPWLLEVEPMLDAKKNPVPMRLRQASPPFLQAVARYLDAVMGQVAGLQVTEPSPGPLVLVQAEHEWFCHHPNQAEGYLHQINRFLRESGCAVPLVNTNNLYQQVAGTIDGWDGDENIFANCRQLRMLQTDAPCLVASLPSGEPDVWGRPHEDPRPAGHVMRKMAEVSAAGGMFNLEPFCGGTNFGFYGGRTLGEAGGFATASRDAHAPLGEAGSRGPKYARVKRLATFLSQFESLMASLQSREHHTVAGTGRAVIQQSGAQGHVVFILRDDDELERDDARHTELITPDGQALPIDLGDDPAAWIVLNANLGGIATLDLTNLRPWAFLGRRMLVLYGPAGSEGVVSIDGTLLLPTVPANKEPLVIDHDNLRVVILNDQQVDAAYPHEGGLYVGVGGIDGEDRPMPHDDFGSYHDVRLRGKKTRHRRKSDESPPAPRLSAWTRAGVDAYIAGTAPRFATLEGPRALETCGADFGYGWYRLRMKRSRPRRVNLLIPGGADRLHMYQGGKLQCLLGAGPGASGEAEPVPLQLEGGETELVFLADNLGRLSEGLHLDQPKGLAGHLLDVKPIKLGTPEESSEPRANPFELTGYVPFSAVDDRSPHPRFTFHVALSAKAPLVLVLRGERPRSMVLINNKPLAIDVGGGVPARFHLDDHLKKGKNKLTLALLDPADEEGPAFDPRRHAALYRVDEVLSEKADWWYARWQMPDTPAYKPIPRATPAVPAFYRATFPASPAGRPLMLDLDGLSKGQVYLNGNNVGRYFVATPTGGKVPPQSRYYLPGPWVHADRENELILFDEHGKSPARAKLHYDVAGALGDA